MGLEIILQSQIFQWAWNTFPHTRKCLFHIPNGGSRNKVEAAHLKASGVVSGVWDMLFIWEGRPYFFEIKSGNGVLSINQRDFADRMSAQGVPCWEIRSLEQFQELFLQIIGQVKPDSHG